MFNTPKEVMALPKRWGMVSKELEDGRRKGLARNECMYVWEQRCG